MKTMFDIFIKQVEITTTSHERNRGKEQVLAQIYNGEINKSREKWKKLTRLREKVGRAC